jgi:heat-inducible transcriptional repressor
MNTPIINERAQNLLKVLVERYIQDGQPVGSRTLARDSRMDLSPATVRNVMADLEEFGLIRSPHTSSGRVPTVKGYRLFIDSLLTVKPLDSSELLSLEQLMGSIKDPDAVLSSASSLLSELTSMAGVVTVPRHEQESLRQLEFLPLSGNRVLVILVFNEREVQNRIIDTSRHFSAAELQQMANYLNKTYAGRDIRKVRESLLRDMEQTKQDMNQLMSTAIEMAQRAFREGAEGEDYVLAGETNLMAYSDMANMDKLRHLFEAFHRKSDILYLLDQSIHASGVQIFVGDESGFEVLDECSIVTAPYEAEGGVAGVLGVIGPTRMAYDRVIPIVDVTARLLGAALNQSR